MRRAPTALAAAAVGVLLLAGCGSDGGDDLTPTPSSSSSPASSPATMTPDGTGVTAPPTGDPTTPVPSSSTAQPTSTTSVAQAPDPTLAPGSAGAWTLTRAASGAVEARQVPSVQCGQDGSVRADGLTLSPGAATLTLTDPAVTVSGTADLDAAGGTFRGRNADTAVTFTWTC